MLGSGDADLDLLQKIHGGDYDPYSYDRTAGRGAPKNSRQRGVWGQAESVGRLYHVDRHAVLGRDHLLAALRLPLHSLQLAPGARRSPLGNPQARGDRFRIAAMPARFLVISEPLGGF